MESRSIIYVLLLFFFLFSPSFSSSVFRADNGTSVTGNQSKKMKLINAQLQKINKPFVKSIVSPDGDIIDCVLFQLQPAFDISKLKEQMSLIPPELPKGYVDEGNNTEIKQLWNSNGESCPNGTIPIRRTTASDLILNSKLHRKHNIQAPEVHEYAIGYVKQGEFYGVHAVLNVWKPYVASDDFSLSQIWIVTDTSSHPINTIEVGWQIYPRKYKDNRPRLFIFWTPDGYSSGCYNLECSGFVQMNNKIVLGGAIHPVSTYGGKQYAFAFTIWKAANTGNWWLRAGNEVVGYWPNSLFTDLRDHATIIQYGGEVSPEDSAKHTMTQMGSGHFQDEGYGKAAYTRNLQVVDQNNNLNSVSNLNILATKPDCYGIKNGYSQGWGNYIYFGGPGDC